MYSLKKSDFQNNSKVRTFSNVLGEKSHFDFICFELYISKFVGHCIKMTPGLGSNLSKGPNIRQCNARRSLLYVSV